MPSSLIFAGLVVLWLLILVPAVARRQQEVVRPSQAALSGRVLARPVRNRSLEVAGMDTHEELDEAVAVPPARTAGEAPDRRDARAEHDAADHDEGYAAAGYYAYDEPAPERDERRWERPPAAFRPGRGGFDAEAAALAARARYALRQRVVIALLVLAVLTAGAAVFVLPALWWAHGLVDVVLVGYLSYLRRQVRMEEAIRARRAARMAGTRRAAAAADPELDGWARRGREAAGPDEEPPHVEEDELEEDGLDGTREFGPTEPDSADGVGRGARYEDADEDWTAEDGSPGRVRGTGEPIGVLPAHRRTRSGQADAAVESALPRLQPAPPPPLPAGTQLVDVDAEDDELPLDTPSDQGGSGGAYRRAAGQ